MSTPCDLELFKQALSDGLDTRYKIITDSYDGDVTPSKKHEDIMKSIMRGVRKPVYLGGLPLRKAVAVALIAAMMAFVTSCSPISDYLKGFIQSFDGYFTSVRPPKGDSSQPITTNLEPTYIPEGYALIKSADYNGMCTYRVYKDANGNRIVYEQSPRNGVVYSFSDIEDDPIVIKLAGCDVYYAQGETRQIYIWYDEVCSYYLLLPSEIFQEEVELIINSITEE